MSSRCFVARRSYSQCVHGVGPEEFARIAARVLTAVPAPLRILPRSGDHGRDALMARPELRPGIVMMATGSGKTATILAMQSKQSIGGFSVSARALGRAAQRARFSAAHELGHYVLDGQSRTSDLAELVCGTPALVIVDEDPASLSDRLRKSLWPAAWIALNPIELGQLLSALAMAARSRFGPSAGPQPTQPPGQVVRTHPRVPRGPSAALRSSTSWPSAGVLSAA